MAFVVHREKQFDRQLVSLEEAGGNAAIAAGNVRLVLERLASSQGGVEIFRKGTKHGELRLKNCRKFDLGNGYRLICLKKGAHIILLFAGTHDECDRWLDRNRGRGLSVEPDFQPSAANQPAPPEEDPALEVVDADYDDELLQKIDDRILREIFSGICRR